MGGPGASNAGGSGANPLRKGMFSSKDCNCNGIASGKPKESARSTGQIDDDDSSEKKVPPDSSDAGTFVKPSDRRKWLLKPNLKAPGTSGHRSTKRFSNSPDIVSPGSGVGPRVLNPGASRSDVAKALKAKGKGIKVPKMFTKAPPGMEDMVMKLKDKYGEDSSTPFKIAWSKYKGEMDAAAKEFLASWTRSKR